MRGTFNDTGDNGEGDPPVLIPNTEVKPFSAGSTWLDTAREIKTLPVTKKKNHKSWFFFFVPSTVNLYGKPRRMVQISSVQEIVFSFILSTIGLNVL